MFIETERPENFSDILGQDAIIPTIESLLDDPRHMILYGSSGVGKTTTARVFANELTNHTKIDIHEVPAAEQTGVDNVRELKRIMALKARSNWKVIIFDEAHRLSTAAFDCLLDVLEAEMLSTVMIFVTTQPWKIPNTIVNRCFMFQFQRIDKEVINYNIKAIADKHDIALHDEAIDVIVTKAMGSMREAVKLLDMYNVNPESILEYQSIADYAESLLIHVYNDELKEFTKLLETYEQDWYLLYDSIADQLLAETKTDHLLY